ncbi:SdpI family protein [Corynebacterium sp. YIM 101645]|uniref:SdpI family protein n=1 Tax=Corynebacterium lemuris TaxID=1859292 RepID=A0ABT2FUC8_9CORY|nr:SdpI family protein [Corynebacterium lemuris]
MSLLFGVVLVSVVCTWVARAGARGDLGRNDAVGLRTRDTRASDTAWQAGHAAALPLLNRTIWIAVATVVLAVVIQAAWGGQWGILVGLGGMTAEVGVLVLATRAANRAAKEVA